MATLTNDQLADCREKVREKVSPIPWSKTTLNAAFQAIEDAWQNVANVGGHTVQAYFALAIENAAPGAFTNTQKEIGFCIWAMVVEAPRNGVS